MDAALNTQSENRGLAMRDIQIFRDGSGGHCLLVVISEPFGASIQFFFDDPIEQFIENLKALEITLNGEAKLRFCLAVRVPLLDLSEQYRSLAAPIRQQIDEVLASQRFILGPKLEQFERAGADAG